jgi:hypothetical protein
MSRPARLAASLASALTLLVAGLSGCGTAPTPTVPAATPAPSTTTRTADPTSAKSAVRATATDVCTGVSGCRRVATIDVDGDARADQVGVLGDGPASGGSITVRVRTATGHTAQSTGRNVYWYTSPFFGAAPLDGRAGAEILVGDTAGAHTQQFRVLTYRKGKLVTLAPPPYVRRSAAPDRSTARWLVDGSYSFSYGIYRSVSASGVTLTLKSAVRNSSGRGHIGHATSYRWRDGGWVEVSAKTVRYPTDASVAGLGGWHVRGLPLFSL